MIKAALFDLDGTLLNRDESIKMFIDSQFDRLNNVLSHVPKEEYIKRFIELDNRGYVWKDRVYQQIVNEFQITHMTWEELLEDYMNEFMNHCVPFSNLINMLEELKRRKMKLGIITNGNANFQMNNIKALGIEHYFGTILVSEWEGIKKPDPRIFKKALKQLNITPEQSIFLGDHPENDVMAAINVGMIGIWKKDEHWNNVDAEFTISELAELPLIIRNLNQQEEL